MNISDSVAVISGGASGLGEGCARRLIELGARGVAIIDLEQSCGEQVAHELGERCLFAPADIADEHAVQRAIDSAQTHFGAVHALVTAAAILLPSKLITKNGPIAMEKFDRIMKVNVYGTLHLIRSAVAAMIKNEPNGDGERGVVVTVSSGAAYEGQIGQVGYSASKAAVVGMTFPLMRELAAYGIRVISIAPGAFDTAIYQTAPPAVKEGILKTALFPRRMGKTSEFAMFVEELIRNPSHNGRSYRFDAGAILAPTP